MANVLVPESALINIAHAIRVVRNIDDTFTPGQMAAAILAINNSSFTLSITSQPVNVTGEVGENASFQVQARGVSPSYTWQEKINGSWQNATVSGSSTNTIYTKITENKTYRCKITDTSGDILFSNEVTITISGIEPRVPEEEIIIDG